MRRTLAVAIIGLILTAFAIGPAKAQTVGETPHDPAVHVKRDFWILEAGLVLLNDTFTLESVLGGELDVADFWTGYQRSFVDERHSFEIWQDDGWRPLDFVEESVEGFEGYRITLPSPVTLRDGVDLEIRASYLFVDRVMDIGDLFEVLLPVYPIVQYNISSFDIRVELPPEAEFDDVYDFAFNFSDSEGIWVLERELEALGSYSKDNASITYTPAPDDKYLLDCQRMELRILIQSGSLRLEDSYSLVNRGEGIRRFTVELPPDASNVKSRDGVGALKTTTNEKGENGHIEAQVTPRSTFRPKDRWVFTIAYSLPKREYITSDGGGTTLKYSLDGFPHYVRELSAVITLPEGGRLTASQPEPTSTEKVGYLTDVNFELGSSLPSERPEIVAELSLSPISSVIRWLGLFFVAAGAIGGVYVMRKRGRREVVKIPVVVERPKLSDFLEQQRERIALFSELEGLQQDLDDDEIDRDRFNIRSAEINRRVDELTRSLRQLVRDLEAESPELREQLVAIRRADEEFERLKNDLRNLDVRLRARRISRRDFERRRRDRLRRRSQAIKRLEQALASLGAGS